jgi:hypothetical protein
MRNPLCSRCEKVFMLSSDDEWLCTSCGYIRKKTRCERFKRWVRRQYPTFIGFGRWIKSGFGGREGFVLATIIFAMVILAVSAVAVINMGLDERRATQNHLQGRLELYGIEGDIQRAIAELDIDSITMPLPGDSVHIGYGVFLHRWSNDPDWSWADTTWINLTQIFTISKGRIRMYATGNPTYFVPIHPEDAPGSPDPHAWKCVLQSKCYNSPNFALDTIPANFQLAMHGYQERVY